MSQKYNIVQLKGPQLDFELIAEVSELAQQNYACDGIEEYSLEEAQVDKILKEKAFSGGDINIDTINQMEKGVLIDQAFRDHFKKIEISDQLKILPSWEKNFENLNDAENVFIYPGQGFGTGNHETTYLCLKLYEGLIKYFFTINDLSCLDFGCGSGILGIAAVKINKFKVKFVDIDKTALENSLQNIAINFDAGLEGTSLVLRDRFKVQVQYNLVFANILEHILIDEKVILLKSLLPNGFLIISGILTHQEENIIKEFSDIDVVQIERKNEWSAILFKNNRKL